jgi:hypothetical protein
MQKASVEAIVSALNQHQVRYLIVGGLAVVAHGYVRLTADVDLMLAVDHENLVRTVAALTSLGYRPRVPVQFDEFVDPQKRQEWARQRNMKVFSLYSPAHPATEIDLFLEPPIDFDSAYSSQVRQEIVPGIVATFCGMDDLIVMKSLANRPRDQQDIDELRKLPRRS